MRLGQPGIADTTISLPDIHVRILYIYLVNSLPPLDLLANKIKGYNRHEPTHTVVKKLLKEKGYGAALGPDAAVGGIR